MQTARSDDLALRFLVAHAYLIVIHDPAGVTTFASCSDCCAKGVAMYGLRFQYRYDPVILAAHSPLPHRPRCIAVEFPPLAAVDVLPCHRPRPAEDAAPGAPVVHVSAMKLRPAHGLSIPRAVTQPLIRLSVTHGRQLDPASYAGPQAVHRVQGGRPLGRWLPQRPRDPLAIHRQQLARVEPPRFDGPSTS